MPSIHLQLEPDQDARTRELARQFNLTRSAYVRRAVDEFNARMERQLLADLNPRRGTEPGKTRPVHQCRNCAQFLLDDAVMARVDQVLAALRVPKSKERAMEYPLAGMYGDIYHASRPTGSPPPPLPPHA